MGSQTSKPAAAGGTRTEGGKAIAVTASSPATPAEQHPTPATEPAHSNVPIIIHSSSLSSPHSTVSSNIHAPALSTSTRRTASTPASASAATSPSAAAAASGASSSGVMTAVTLDTSSFAHIPTPVHIAHPTFIYETPALTTTFTPPPECTGGHLTMLMSDAWKIWHDEPMPVPNITVSDCYPPQFMTSYLAARHSTTMPAFSPLVCPGNYHTVSAWSLPDRPLYIACCPSDYELAPPSTSIDGRPAYGGTCYSPISTVSVTLYNNSTSAGMTLFASPGTTNQAYAHPIDGFAMVTAATTAAATALVSGSPAPAAPLSSGIIAGIAVGATAVIAAMIGAILLCVRARRAERSRQQRFSMERNSPTDETTLISFPYHEKASRSDSHVPEMPSSLAWVNELPPKNPLRHQLFVPPQEMPTVRSPPPLPSKLLDSPPDSPAPVLMPPPRSPDRDLPPHARRHSPPTYNNALRMQGVPLPAIPHPAVMRQAYSVSLRSSREASLVSRDSEVSEVWPLDYRPADIFSPISPSPSTQQFQRRF